MTPFDIRLPIIAAEARVKTCHVHHCWHAMHAMGEQFHVAAFAEFAGLTPEHVESIMKALVLHNSLPRKRAETVRGTRLAHDWAIPHEWVMWASEKRHWHPAVVEEEALIFADYWHSRSGQGAVKVDWLKTWQNWVRQSHRPDGDYIPRKAFVDPLDRAASMERTAALYDKMGRTKEAAELRAQLQSNVVSIRAANT
jgi:hypothetical protein